MNRLHATVSGLWGRVRSAVRERGTRQKSGTAGKHLYSQRRSSLSPEKQKELDALCHQLFKRQDLITSGKLQLIGLSGIKKRMGKRWAGLCQVVYDTTEEVIKTHTERSDLFIRYQDESYVILFARATLEEGTRKAEMIAEDIRRRLFAMDEEDLRRLEIRQAVKVMRAAQMGDGGMLDAMDALFGMALNDDDNGLNIPGYGADATDDDAASSPVASTDVGTAQYRKRSDAAHAAAAALPAIERQYIPIWDVQRKALTIYLCLAVDEAGRHDLFEGHVAYYRQAQESDRLAIDLQGLNVVGQELAAMAAENRKLMICCPVQYETLHNFESYEVYKNACEAIPPEQRTFLSFLVMIPEGKLAQKDAYWFVKPMRSFTRYVFAEIPMSGDLNFSYLRNTGVDAVGVRINPKMGEPANITQLNALAAKARSYKIPFTFVLGVSTLSLATSIVCAGFDYVGGILIHENIRKPEAIKPYGYENLAASTLRRNRKA